MKDHNSLLQSFYKSLISPNKHAINICDILLFSALLRHWSTIVQNISESKQDDNNSIEISKVKDAVLYIDITDIQRLFMLSFKTHAIVNFCNALLQTVDWFEIGKSIGLESFDIPDGEIFIKKVSLNGKH